MYIQYSTYVYTVHTSVCLYINTCAYNVCMYNYVYARMYKYTFICTYIHKYNYT